MGTPVEQIKERLGIADVVGSYIKLERAGASLKAKCPFHNERTPSFFVSPARGSYYCFGCQKGGDIFSFVQEFEGLDFVGALRVLASRAGVELRRVDPKIQSEYARLYLCLEKATRFFEKGLSENSEALAYLAERGLTKETIKDFRLGFVPNEWRTLFDHLSAEGFTPLEIEKVGLVKRKESGPLTLSKGEMREGVVKFYDAFRGRIMFPIMDSAGRVIAFSGRLLPVFDDGKSGKYINSPEGALFNKSAVLYGFDKAKMSIRQKDAAILVEGQMDLLMAHQAGYSNAVAVSGTALTEQHVERLKRLSENLLVAFDSDSAGKSAALRAIRLALARGCMVRVVSLADGKDPAELIAKNKNAWEKSVREAVHVIDFFLEGILSSAADGREQALRIEKELLSLLAFLPSAVEKAHFVKHIAERARLREDALWEAFKKIPTPVFEKNTVSSSGNTKNPPRLSAVPRRVFSLLFFAEASGEKEKDRARAFFNRLTDMLRPDRFAELLKTFTPEREVLLVEAEAFYGGAFPGERESEELLRNLEEEELSALFAESLERLSRAERDKNPEAARDLLSECKKFSERLEKLKSFRFSK